MTKIILHNTIDEALCRGEKLNDIIEKNNEILKSKKINNCCYFM